MNLFIWNRSKKTLLKHAFTKFEKNMTEMILNDQEW